MQPNRQIHAIVQTTNANKEFDGALPDQGFQDEGRVRTYAPSDSGGLFEFPTEQDSTIVHQIELRFIGGTEFTIGIVGPDGVERRIAQQAFLTDVIVFTPSVVSLIYPFILTQGEKLKLTTTTAGGGNKGFAKVMFQKWQPVTTY